MLGIATAEILLRSANENAAGLPSVSIFAKRRNTKNTASMQLIP